MADDQVIDLTVSDDDVSPSSSSKAVASATGSKNSGTSTIVADSTKPEANDSVRNPKTKSSTKSGRESSNPGGKSLAVDPNHQNGSSSLLSRIGGILHENARENKPRRSRKGKDRIISDLDQPSPDSAARFPTARQRSHQPQPSSSAAHPRRSRSRSPKAVREAPVSELPVDQLFFIDTRGDHTSTQIELGTKTLNRSKEHKNGNSEAPTRIHGSQKDSETAPEVQFVGGDALTVSSAHVTTDITPATTAVTDSTRIELVKQPADGTASAVALALPSHVTLWTEGDPDISLEDVTAGEPEGIEYVDYDEDQATGAARYFVPEGTVKKICRTCGDEGHTAKYCTRLICLTCGERDDHDTRNCPMRVVCFNCGGNGHLASTCPQPRQPRGQNGCDRCGSHTHIHQRCLDQFKTYVYLSDSERLQLLEERAKLEDLSLGEGGEGYIARHIWCYNCGRAGHWGDGCSETRAYGAPRDPCALSSHNASRGPFGEVSDGLISGRNGPRPAWTDDDPHLQDVGRRGKEANIKRHRAAEAARAANEKDDDDWFSRAAGSSSGSRGNKPRSLPPKPRSASRDRDARVASEKYRSRRRNRDQEGNKRRREDEGSRRDRRDSRDDDRRRRSRNEERGGPQYRGSYA